MNESHAKRPWGITGLSVFFALGAGLSFIAWVSLLTPGGPLEPLWDMNPRAHAALEGTGPAGVTLMSLVSVACGFATVGLWTGALWGYRTAAALLVLNLLAEITNVVLGVERRAIIGVPILAGLLAFLSTKQVRSYFGAQIP